MPTKKQLEARIRQQNLIIKKQRKQIKEQKIIIRKQRKEIKQHKRIEKQQQLESKERLRRQYVMNFTSSDDPYYISIRAMTINPAYSYDDLKRYCISYRNKIHNTTIHGYKINFHKFKIRFGGIEPPTKLGTDEDKELNDMIVHIEIKLKNNRIKPLYFTEQ